MTEPEDSGTKKPGFLRTFLIYGAGQAVRLVAGLILFPVYTRFLTPDDYGILSLVGAFGSAVLLFFGTGVPTSIFRFYMAEDDDKGRGEVLRACLNLIGLALIPTLLLMSISRTLAGWLLDDRQLWVLLVLMLVATYADLLSKIPLAPIRARRQSALYVTLNLISVGSTLTLSFTFVVVLRWGLIGIVLAQALVIGTWAVALTVHLLRQSLVRRGRPGLMWKMTKYGLPLVLAYFAQFLLTLSDRFILKFYMPLSAVGHYAVAHRLAEVITVATAVFAFTWVPFAFDEGKTEEGRRLMSRVGTTWLGLILLGGVAIGIFAREALWILTPPAYYHAASTVPVLVIGLGFWATYPITSMGLQIADRTSYLPYMNGAAAALNIGLNVLWIPSYGLLGAAWASAAAYAMLFALSLTFSQRCFRLPLPLFRWGVAIVLAMGAGWLGLRAERFDTLSAVWVKAAVLAGLFGAYSALGLTGVEHIRDVLRGRRRQPAG